MKFLIIRFSSIGDIVLTTPVVRCLKQQIATAEVHYLSKSVFRPILAANPYIDKLHFLDHDLDATIEELKKEDFDYVIDLHHNFRTVKVKRALGKRTFSFNKLNLEKLALVRLKWDIMPDKHIVDRYLETVASFGVKNDGAGLDYFIPREEIVKEEDIPTSHQAGYVGLVIGAALNTKKMPLHKMKEICQAIDHPVILLGGPEDAAAGEELTKTDPIKIYNACGKFSLNESADLVRRARVVVSPDTGLMHIAAAFKRPVISVWGNTVPRFGMGPYYGSHYLRNFAGGGEAVSGKGDVATGGALAGAGPQGAFDIVEVRHLGCRPCSKIGYKKCPRGHFKCMELIRPEEVLEKIYARLKR